MNPTVLPASDDAGAKRLTIAFINWAHAMDHLVILIFPTVVIGLVSVFQRSYGELIALGTASFVAFGLFSLPAGWLADRWSRRNMMIAFYIGCGLSLVGAALSPGPIALAVALFVLGIFAAIYHPVGMPMLIDVSDARGRTLAFNGVCGNLGAALAAGITGALAYLYGWRAAFLAPALVCIASGVAMALLIADDRHRTGKRESVAAVSFSPRVAWMIFGLYVVISICGGLTFNTVSIALPKLVDERAGQDLSLLVVGGLTTAVFMCGAVAQLLMGRLVERFPPYILFALVVALQLAGIVWASHTTGLVLLLAMALAMGAIYAQVTLGDIVVARYTADAWRGRIYAVRYFLTFLSAGIAASVIAYFHTRGGFDLVLTAIAGIAAILLLAVIGFVVLVADAEAKRASPQPAE